MQAFKQISRFLSICLLAFTVIVQPAAASNLADDPFIRQNLDRRNFEPGGKYHLFGSRGVTAKRTGRISIIPTGEQTFIHNKMETALISGDIGYTTRFNGHGHHVHAPFDNHASRSDKSSNGQFAIDRTIYSLQWTGHEHHPADGYDGPQGSGYPAPTGARDEYSYKIEGLASRISVIQPDNTTSSRNRIENRFTDAGKAFTERIPSAWEKATTHNPTKDGVGNAAEAFNATFSGINNVLGAGLGILGAGDIAEFGLTALAVGNVENAGAIDEDSQIAFVQDMIAKADAVDRWKSAYGSWQAAHPNAAEVIEAVTNIATSSVGLKAVTAVKGIKAGKAAEIGSYARRQSQNNTFGKFAKREEVGIEWGKGNFKQGMPWEDYVGKGLPANARLPKNFKTFDYFDRGTGKAISAKTLDTQTTARLAKPEQIYNTMKGYIDKTANFERHNLSGVRLRANMIKQREIHLAVPAQTNSAQRQQLQRVIEYGKDRNVTVKITEIK